MLTKRQKELLDFIDNYIDKKGYSPSLEEMAKKLKLSSLSSVHYHLSRLQEKGLISRNPESYRSVQISENSESVTEIPFIGVIAGGQPIEAFEEKETITVPKAMFSLGGEHFALRVSGDSMKNAGIFDHDIVVIRKQEIANEGDIVVAIVNGNEATLKKIYKEKNGFRLQPENENMKPIFTKELLVQGKVVSILRNLNNEIISEPVKTIKPKQYIHSKEYLDEENINDLVKEVIEFKDSLFDIDSELLNRIILKKIFELIAKGNTEIVESIFENNLNDLIDRNKEKEIENILSKYNFDKIENDILGSIYQNIRTQEDRKDSGQYYTPNKVVDYIIDNLEIDISKNKNLKIFDPACGSGQFLVRAYDKLLSQYEKMEVDKDIAHKNIIEKHLYGSDIDPVACILTKANLFLRNRNIHNINFNVFNFDFLKKDYGMIEKDPFSGIYNEIDFVVGNPPWGATLNKEQKKYFNKYYEIGDVGLNTFTLFIERSFDFLKDKGKLGFLIPEAYLKIKVHQLSRQQILKNSEVKLLAISGDIFKKVYAPSLVLIFQKTKSISKDNKILVQEGVFNGGIKERKLPQSLFENTPDNIFNIHFSDLSVKIIQQIESLDNVFLKDNTLFILGIVTGNNKKYLLPKKVSNEYSPIIVGKDLSKFKINFGENYFIYDKNVLQQVAPRSYYEEPEKLIYKFIGKNLTFVYDNQKRFTLNNANAIVPRIPNVNIKYILGILNSELIQFYYSKSFFTVRVLRGNLERLPIFKATKQQQSKMISLVEKIEKSEEEEFKKLNEELNNFVYDLYKITEDQKDFIKKEIK